MRAERGMVTVELALVSLLVGGALVLAGWVLAQLVAFDLCQVTANEVARQAARGDDAAMARALADRPADAEVTLADGGGAVAVTCRLTPRLLGVPVASLDAGATVLAEARE